MKRSFAFLYFATVLLLLGTVSCKDELQNPRQSVECLIDGELFPMQAYVGYNEAANVFTLDIAYYPFEDNYRVMNLIINSIPFKVDTNRLVSINESPYAFFERVEDDLVLDTWNATPDSSNFFHVSKAENNPNRVSGSFRIEFFYDERYGPRKSSDLRDTFVVECKQLTFMLEK